MRSDVAQDVAVHSGPRTARTLGRQPAGDQSGEGGIRTVTEQQVAVGIIGCGNISGIYFETARKFPILRIAACADLDLARAQARGTEFGVRACTVDELLADPEIAIVINLTVPRAHAAVSMAILEAGKHVYTEKPLTTTLDDATRVLNLARERHLRVGSAPDTALGGGIQTCRKLIDDGWIGTPVAASAFMTCHGHETWHPDPAFYYQVGGGPMLDMGPYYMSALITCLGPAQRVTGMASRAFAQRIVTSTPKYGTVIPVEVPTHLTGAIAFANGAVTTMTMSFDIWAAQLPSIEIYGTEGSLSVPDPNGFGGPVRIHRGGDSGWQDVPLTHGNTVNSRGLGVADMAYALRSGRPHRANGEVAYHALEIMQAFATSSDSGQVVDLQSTCSRPAAVPMDLRPGTLDD